MSKGTKVHTRYYLANGKEVPSVTTVLSDTLPKPQLIHWAWEQGIAGNDYRKIRDRAGSAGTIAHEMILEHLTGEELDVSEYPPRDVETAKNSFKKYLDWEKEHSLEPLLVEHRMVSEIFGFGGTIDLLARVDNNMFLSLIDFKTSKGIYADMLIQLAAYDQLLREAGYEIGNARILRIGRNEDEGFEEKLVTNLDKQWELFEHLLAIYKLKKELK